jgi:O-antigen biosynthesis protein
MGADRVALGQLRAVGKELLNLGKRVELGTLGLDRKSLEAAARTLFDESYYVSQVPAASKHSGGPWAHFCEKGWRANHDPHPLFSVEWYRHLATDMEKSGLDPLSHYWSVGCLRPIDPHPLFSTSVVKANLVNSKYPNALAGYLTESKQRRLRCHPLFDPEYYCRQYPDVAESGQDPLIHYLMYGWREQRNPSPYFDSSWYLAKHADVKAAGVNPAIHVLMAGLSEKRVIHPLFDIDWYCFGAPDVVAAGINPYLHFVTNGDREGRSPHPLFDPTMYRNANPEMSTYDGGAFAHFMEYGGWQLKKPCPALDLEHFTLMSGAKAPFVRNPIFDYLDAAASDIRHSHPLIDGAYQRLSSRKSFVHAADELKDFVQFRSSFWPADEAYGATSIPSPRRALHATRQSQTSEPGNLGGIPRETPKVSILTPCYNTNVTLLKAMVDSVRTQSYRNWELILLDDCSPDAQASAAIKSCAQLDKRIRVSRLKTNSGIALATNAALKLATGQYVAMLDHDDILTPNALESMVSAIVDAAADAAYSDQAYISHWGTLEEPFYKPDWSPTLLTGVMYVGHLLMVKTSIARQLKGFDPSYDRCQDFEFMLRVGEKTDRICHVPEILYHWRRTPGSVAHDASSKGKLEPVQAAAVNAHFRRIGFLGEAEPHPVLPHRQVINPLQRKSYPSLQVIMRADRPASDISDATAMLQKLPAKMDITLLEADGPQDGHKAAGGTIACEALTQALKASKSEYILFLDPSVSFVNERWFDYLMMYAERDKTAFVAQHIIHSNGLVCTAGLSVNASGGLIPVHAGTPAGADGYAGSLGCDREVSSVSSACTLVRRKTLSTIGPWNGNYSTLYYLIGEMAWRASLKGLKNISVAGGGGIKVADDYKLQTPAAIVDQFHFVEAHAQNLALGDPYFNRNFVPNGTYALA